MLFFVKHKSVTMLSKFNNSEVVKKKIRLQQAYLIIIELLKQLELSLKLNLNLTKEQKILLVKEIEKILNTTFD